MSKCTIELTDAEGAISCTAHFERGFNPLSHAHQHAQILLRMMDDLCSKSGEATEVVASGHDISALTEALKNAHARAKDAAQVTAGA